MTNFARCDQCVGLTLDNPEDVRQHRNDHRHYDKQLEATRRLALELKNLVGELRAEIADYRRELEQHPVAVEPDQIVINDFPEDDEPLEAEEPEDLETDDELEPTTAPAADYTVLPAIDREDTYATTPAAPTGAVQNLFNG